MELTDKQIAWLEKATPADLLKARPRLTKEQYKEIEGVWKKIHNTRELALDPSWWIVEPSSKTEDAPTPAQLSVL